MGTKFFCILYFISVILLHAQGKNLSTSQRQVTSCSTDRDCDEGLIFPFLSCVGGTCQSRTAPSDPLPSSPPSEELALSVSAEGDFTPSAVTASAVRTGVSCFSLRDCDPGLVCVSGNPAGKCTEPKGVLGLATLAQNLVQEDYTPTNGATSDSPEQGGPTRTSRALAIIFLAAHDTLGLLTGSFSPKLSSAIARRRSSSFQRSARAFGDGTSSGARGSSSTGSRRFIFSEQVEFASIAAGLRAAELLYPRSKPIIEAVRDRILNGSSGASRAFGELIARIWVRVRSTDGSALPQLDSMFEDGFLRHQADPNFNIVTGRPGSQQNFGRTWGNVTPFLLRSVRRDAFLGPFPDPSTEPYLEDLLEVEEKGQCNDLRTPDGVPIRDIGTYWGYDSMPEIGVPPRLYLQVVLAVPELQELSFANQLRAMTGVNVAMADAGIAAWFWKFFYDLWRPTLGIREDPRGNATWSPVGIAHSNIAPLTVPKCIGLNPNFPAYPSGHSSFGSAAFNTMASLLRKRARDVRVEFTSDEFNGRTTDGVDGSTRRVFTQKISLEEAIRQNEDSRVFLGVHWRFDSDGGDIVGKQVAKIAAREFRFV